MDDYETIIGSYELNASFEDSGSNFAWVTVSDVNDIWNEITMVYLYEDKKCYTLVTWDYYNKPTDEYGKYIGKDGTGAYIYVFDDIDDYLKTVREYKLGRLALGFTDEERKESSEYNTNYIDTMISEYEQEFYEFINEFRVERIMI